MTNLLKSAAAALLVALACVSAIPASAQSGQPSASCIRWFDGCNTCGRSANGVVICTKRYCGGTKGKFRCLERVVMPKNCRRYFDGCNTCRRVGGQVSCTDRDCESRQPARCLVDAAGRPANCIRWFDGCNTCRRTSAGWACTRRACGAGQRKPARCLQRR
jgi:hypothetical protein